MADFSIGSFGALPIEYRSQNGRRTKITAMVDEYLGNAIAKLTRTGSDPRMLQALQGEQKRRSGR